MGEPGARCLIERYAVVDGVVVALLFAGEIFAGERLAVDGDEALEGEVGDPGVLVEGEVVGVELAVLVAVLVVGKVEVGEAMRAGLGVVHAGDGLLDEEDEAGAAGGLCGRDAGQRGAEDGGAENEVCEGKRRACRCGHAWVYARGG